MEIYPKIAGDYCFNKANERVTKYSSKEVEVRALVEGQFVARRALVEDFGLIVGPNTRIIATGGVSANKTILQVLSDVFNSPVYALVCHYFVCICRVDEIVKDFCLVGYSEFVDAGWSLQSQARHVQR